MAKRQVALQTLEITAENAVQDPAFTVVGALRRAKLDAARFCVSQGHVLVNSDIVAFGQKVLRTHSLGTETVSLVAGRKTLSGHESLSSRSSFA